MNARSADLVTPAMEKAGYFCATALPHFDERQVNPIEALDTGTANCVPRAFFIATILEELEGETGFLVHPNPYEAYAHVMTLAGTAIVNANSNTQALEITPLDSSPNLFKGGLVIYGDPILRLSHYVDMYPDLPKVPERDMVEAQEIVRARLKDMPNII